MRWDPWLDHGDFVPGALLDVLYLGAELPGAPVCTGIGIQRVRLPAVRTPPILPGASGDTSFLVDVPADFSLLGAVFLVQALSFDPLLFPPVRWSSSLEIVIGCE